MNKLGVYRQSRGQFGEAEPLYRRALAIDEASYGPDHPNVASRPQQPGELLHEPTGWPRPSRYTAASGDRRSVVRSRPPRRRHDLNNLAGLLQATNRLAEAEPLYRRLWRSTKRRYGPDHPNVAIQPQQPGGAAAGHQPAGRGRAAIRRALAIDEASYGPDHPASPSASTTWRSCCSHQPPGRGRAAIPPGSGDRRSVVRSRPPRRCHDLNNLAVLLQATNRLAEAEPLIPPRSGDRRSVVRSRPPQRRHDLNNLAELLQATNRLAEAEPLYRRALAIDEAVVRSRPPRRRHASTTWRSCCRPPTGWPRPSRSTAGRWRSTSSLRPGPPQCRHRPQQPGGAAAGHQPPGRGRAAIPPGTCRSDRIRAQDRDEHPHFRVSLANYRGLWRPWGRHLTRSSKNCAILPVRRTRRAPNTDLVPALFGGLAG